MKRTIHFRFIVPVLIFIFGCQGLELTFTHDWLLAERKGCAIVLCEESYQELGIPKNSTSVNASVSDAPGHQVVTSGSISEMLIFKHARQSTLSDRGQRHFEQKRLIASLTSKLPTVTQVSDGVKIDGQLTARGATLRLGLYKQDDCRAEFTCEVRGVDSKGNNQVTSSRLVQQHMPQSNRFQDDTGTLSGSAGVILTMFSLFREMDNKLVQTGHETVNSLQTRLQSLENRLEDRLIAIENRLEDKVLSIENRLQNKLETFEERIIHKTTSMEKDFQNGLETFQKKLNDEISEKVSSLLTQLGSDSTPSMQNVSKMVQRNQQLGGVCCKDMEETLLNISVVTQESKRYLVSIDQSLEQKFQQLSTSINNSIATPDCFNLHDILSEAQANTSKNVQAAITDVLTLKTCEKNVFPVLPHPSYPYPMVRPNKETPFDFPYLCDTFTDGGGWIVIQRRSSGDVDFFRTWEEYKNGFGSLDDDFWLGNEKIHIITNSATYELRITLKYQGVTKYAHYSSFSLSSERSNYILSIGTYDGTAGDALKEHKGRQFSTKDRDNDSQPSQNCATTHHGAWWYKACYHSNLNGKWGADSWKGPTWLQWAGDKPMTFTEMKIRMVDDS